MITQGYSAKAAAENIYKSNPTILEIFRRPFDTQWLLNEMKQYKRILVCEEQQLRGGLGSEILELINDSGEQIHLERNGIHYGPAFPHTFGSREYWMEQYGVDPAELRRKVDGGTAFV